MNNLLETVNDALASRIKQASRHAVHTVQATPVDKLDYRPSETAKSVRDLAQHIVVGNNLCLTSLGLEAIPEPDSSDMVAMTTAIEQGGALFTKFAAEASDSTLSKSVSFFGNEIATAKFLMIVEWHISRHSGQIDYLQTTWGDMEDRFFG